MTPPRLDFHWRLRQIMTAHHVWRSAELARLLRQRGINLSYSQVRRLVSHKPERLSMRVLVALCDIFGCTPSDLITPNLAPQAGDRPALDG